MSCLGLLPPFQEQCDFRFSTDQRCESSWLRNIKATCGTTLTQDLVHGDRLSNTSECLFAQVLAGKIALDQVIGRTTDHKSIGRSQPLDSGGDIWCLAQCQLFLTPCSAHFSNNDQSSMNP